MSYTTRIVLSCHKNTVRERRFGCLGNWKGQGEFKLQRQLNQQLTQCHQGLASLDSALAHSPLNQPTNGCTIYSSLLPGSYLRGKKRQCLTGLKSANLNHWLPVWLLKSRENPYYLNGRHAANRKRAPLYIRRKAEILIGGQADAASSSNYNEQPVPAASPSKPALKHICSRSNLRLPASLCCLFTC